VTRGWQIGSGRSVSVCFNSLRLRRAWRHDDGSVGLGGVLWMPAQVPHTIANLSEALNIQANHHEAADRCCAITLAARVPARWAAPEKVLVRAAD
jgi:hypothetical protein